MRSALRAGYMTRTIPLALVLHNDTVRSHVANRCATCHPADCWICDRAGTIFSQSGPQPTRTTGALPT